MRLNLGDRVQVQLPNAVLNPSDETDGLNAHKGERLPCGGQVIGHKSQQQERLGTVDECSGGFPCRFGSQLGHGYLVRYDRQYIEADQSWWGGHYADSELVPATVSLETNNPPRWTAGVQRKESDVTLTTNQSVAGCFTGASIEQDATLITVQGHAGRADVHYQTVGTKDGERWIVALHIGPLAIQLSIEDAERIGLMLAEAGAAAQARRADGVAA